MSSKDCLNSLLIVVVCVVALSTTSQGEEKKPKKEWLVGEWTGRMMVAPEEMKKDPVFAGIATDEESWGDLAEQMQKQLDANTFKMTIKENGEWTKESDGPGIAVSDKKKTGKWKVLEIKGDAIKVKWTDDSKKTDEETTYRFSGKYSITQTTDTWVIPQYQKQ